jgi:hypothetical protein
MVSLKSEASILPRRISAALNDGAPVGAVSGSPDKPEVAYSDILLWLDIQDFMLEFLPLKSLLVCVFSVSRCQPDIITQNNFHASGLVGSQVKLKLLQQGERLPLCMA